MRRERLETRGKRLRGCKQPKLHALFQRKSVQRRDHRACFLWKERGKVDSRKINGGGCGRPEEEGRHLLSIFNLLCEDRREVLKELSSPNKEDGSVLNHIRWASVVVFLMYPRALLLLIHLFLSFVLNLLFFIKRICQLLSWKREEGRMSELVLLSQFKNFTNGRSAFCDRRNERRSRGPPTSQANTF